MCDKECPSIISFQRKLLAQAPLLGIFQKLPTYQATELLADGHLDYIVIDAEHAVFTDRELDSCVLAARAGGLPVFVRIPQITDSYILSALDIGANGLVVPHVKDAATAERAISSSHYLAHEGTRGFSNSPRAARYGLKKMDAHIRDSDTSVMIICQIENREAVETIGEIAAVEGVSGLLVGPADLMLSYRCTSPTDVAFQEAIEQVASAARENDVPLGIAIADADQISGYLNRGFSFFVVGSEQSLIVAAMAGLSQKFQELTAGIGNRQP